MKCPRCKEENKEQAVVCAVCNLKLKTACPRCKALNKIGQPKCSVCNLMLIRFCPECKTPNFPNAPNCRKCTFQLLKPKPQETNSSQSKPTKQIQQSFPPQKAHVIPMQATQIAHAPKLQNTEQAQKELIPEKKSEQVSVAAEIPYTATPEQPQPQKQESQQNIQNIQGSFAQQMQGNSTTETTFKHSSAQAQTPPPHFFADKKELPRTEASEAIARLIKTSESGVVVSISAPDGAGKSTMLSNVTQSLQQEQILWLIGTCQPLAQLTPYSLISDMLKTLFGMPIFLMNLSESQKALKDVLDKSFNISNTGTDAEIFDALSRILFNDFSQSQPSIKENHEFITNALCSFINRISYSTPVSMIVEDFEYIDSASLECLKVLFTSGFLDKKDDKKNFVLINHIQTINLQEVFPLESLKSKIKFFSLKPMSIEEMEASILVMLNNQDIIPQKIKTRILQCASSMPFYIEQALWYLFQTGALIAKENGLEFNKQAENIELPPTIEELIALRIKLIENTSADALKIIFASSLFGYKFPPAAVQLIENLDDQHYNQIMQMLLNGGIFAPVDQNSIRFKHGLIWKYVYENGFTEEQVAEYGVKLIEFYSKYTLNTSSAVLARHAEEAKLPKDAYNFYSLAAQESLALGDYATYTDYQNKVIELLLESEIDEEQKNEFRRLIEENIGKANYEFNPKIAVPYLSNSILAAEQHNNIVKVIDLTGYLARSCELGGNFNGVLECCDKALSLIDKAYYPMEHILLNYYKLESTFNLGRLEETIVNANNEVLPALNDFLSRDITIDGLDVSDIKKIEFETLLTLSKAFVYQGNKLSADLCANIASKAEKEGFTDYELIALLHQALFVAIQGNIKDCNAMLANIKEKFNALVIPDKFKIYWYFIAVLSNLTTGNFRQASELCYSGIMLSTIFKEYNMLAILKLVLGKCYEEFGQLGEAYTIYNETVNYCSENKMATGALISWYMAANTEYKSGDYEKSFQIAERALEISQKPNISNHLVEVLIQNLIAKLRTQKGDFEGAQIAIETAISVAEKNNLILNIIDLYLTFGDIYRQNASTSKENSAKATETANTANRLYMKALSFAEGIENDFLVSVVEKKISTLYGFCKQNNIRIEKVN